MKPVPEGFIEVADSTDFFEGGTYHIAMQFHTGGWKHLVTDDAERWKSYYLQKIQEDRLHVLWIVAFTVGTRLAAVHNVVTEEH